MAKFDVKIQGNKTLIRKLDQLEGKARKAAEAEIERAAENIETQAKNNVPVDLGFLKGSGRSEANGLNAEVVFNADYAAYVEFGTGAAVEIPPGLEDYAARFKGAGVREVNLPAQPFLFPAVAKERPQLIQRLRKAINKAMK